MALALTAFPEASSQGLAGGLRPPPPSDTTTSTARNSPAVPSEDAELNRQIASLRSLMASTDGLTIATIEPVADLAAADERAAEYRRRVNAMRNLLYLPDPKPEESAGRALAGFRDRWRDLTRAILDGDVPSARIAPDDWSRYASRFSRLQCADRAPAAAPAGGMPLGGWAWACLSDLFFHELAELEVGVDSAMTARRRALTEPLERAMSMAEDRLAEVHRVIGNSSSPRLLLRDASWQLFQVWRQLTELRLQELEAEKRAGGSTPAFRWLLEISPVVRRRPEVGAAEPIVAPAGATLQASLESMRGEATVAAPMRTTLARRLHRIHYRLTMLAREGGGNEERRASLESERARTLTSIAEQAR
jgi:hypothetical protein